MKDLVILGIGVHAAEMAEIAERASCDGTPWRLRGFIAPQRHADRVGAIINGYPVLGTHQVLGQYPEARFVPDNEYDDPIDLPPGRVLAAMLK